MEQFKPLIAKVATGVSLSSDEAQKAFDVILAGEATPAQLGAFLMALRVRGETIDEITGAVQAMRARMLRVEAPAEAIDIVGTGGDGLGSYNVSTLASLIVAGCGVLVAKHGNRAASSRSGAADVLSALGVKIGMSPEQVSRCIRTANIGFMAAHVHHAAMRNVVGVRSEIGTRTIFNLLGPMSNPAGVKRQLFGVFAAQWLEPLAKALRQLGSERVWLIHGMDGLDEISTTGETQVVALENGQLRSFVIVPEDAGLPRVNIDQLKGGTPEENAEALLQVLQGARTPFRDIAVLNAAAALVICEKAENLREGALLAQKSLDEGKAATVLQRLISVSNEG